MSLRLQKLFYYMNDHNKSLKRKRLKVCHLVQAFDIRRN